MAGRPNKYETPEDLEKAVEEYFNDGEVTVRTITGLAYHLGFESRQSFYDYENDDQFSYTIKRARLRIEIGYEIRLSGNNCVGAIFALKNLGWKDKTEIDQTLKGGVNIIIQPQDGNDPIRD